MRNIQIIKRNGKYGVLDDDSEAVPFTYDNPIDALAEWEYFERLNTNSEPHRRFLNHVTPMEEIEEVSMKLRQ